jgi:hypothetical protein
MRPEADVYAYVQDLEKHLQVTSFGGMADPEWAFEGRCGHDLMLPRDGIPHTVRPGSSGAPGSARRPWPSRPGGAGCWPARGRAS